MTKADDKADKREQATLGDEAEDLRLLADSARDFAMIVTDKERHIVRWSAGAEHVLGWSEAEVCGKNEVDLIFTPEDKVAGVPQQEQDTAEREGRAEDERWCVKKDGTRFWASGVMVPLYDTSSGTLKGFGKVLRDVTAQKRAEDAVREANDQLEARVQERTRTLHTALSERQEMLRQIVRVQEQERARLSRELHDQTGQDLTALSLGLAALTGDVNAPAGTERLKGLRELLAHLARDLHHIAMELRPTSLEDMGLPVALETYVQEWSQRFPGGTAQFESRGFKGHERLAQDIETTIYRVVQEALTNVLRHAEASRVSVLLDWQADTGEAAGEARVIVEDNGRGFDPEARTKRLGVTGMRERAALVGGTLEIESSLGQGTTVFLRIPLTQQKQPGRADTGDTRDAPERNGKKEGLDGR